MVRSKFTTICACVIAWSGVQAQVQYQPEITDAVINTRTIDTSKPVGVIAGEAGVSSIGSATYTIPITVPPGTNGMEPQLALTYNSNGGDGELGIGWGMAAISRIQRVGSDNYHDGITAPVAYSEADHYALDGQRLVNVTHPLYQSSGYDTEVAQFNFYAQVGTYGSGPAGFRGVRKDGMLSYYGHVDDESESALVQRSSGDEALAWMLSKVVDPFGNEIRYYYSAGSLNEAKRLTSIAYTSNPAQGISAYNTVEFIYNTRSDKTTLYNAGSEIKNEYLLERIEVNADHETVRAFDLKYALRQDISYLCEVIESGSQGSTLNSTIIKYGDVPLNVAEISEFSGVNGQNVHLYTADFDGNGKADILAADIDYDIHDDQTTEYVASFHVYMNGSASSTYSYAFSGPGTAVIVGYGGAQGFLAADYNGDGRDDIVVKKMHWDASEDQFFFTGALMFLSISASEDNDANFNVQDIGRPDPGSSDTDYSWFAQGRDGAGLVTGDFDGDGKFELLSCLFRAYYPWGQPHDPIISLWEYNNDQSSGWVPQNVSMFAISAFSAAHDFTTLDINGDGKMELYGRTQNGDENNPQSTLNLLGKGSDGTWFWSISNVSVSSWQVQVAPADFNGDGASDVLIRKGEGGSWVIRYSNGYGLGPEVAFGLTESNGSMVRVADINGDGRTDIVHCYYSGSGQYEMKLYISKGLYGGAIFTTMVLPSYANHNFASLAMGDFNGDGKMDLINRHYYQSPADIYKFWSNSHYRRVDKIVNGVGVKVDFDFKYMTDPAVYTQGMQQTEYPDHSVQFALPVVWKVGMTNGVGGTNTVTHSYGEGWAWVNGPGFVGFKEHTVMDPVANRRSWGRSVPSGSVAGMFSVEQSVAAIDPPTQISHTTLNGGANVLNAGMRRYSYHLWSSFEQDMLAGTQVETQNNYWDDFDNLHHSVVTTDNIITEDINYEYETAGTYPNPTKLHRKTVSTTRDGEAAVTVVTRLDHDHYTGALQRKVENENKAIQTTTEYAYFPTGNVEGMEVYYTGIAQNGHRVEHWTYDERFRFEQTHSKLWYNNGQGLDITEEFEWDNKWGVILSHLSTDNLRTDYSYDEFGRLKRINAPHIPGQPRPGFTQYIRQWAYEPGLDGVYSSLVQVSPTDPVVTKGYDQLGREVRTRTAAFDPGAWTEATTVYDQQGRIASKTLPHLPGEDEIRTDFTYDEFGRRVLADNNYAGPTTYAYEYVDGLLTTTVTAAGRSSSTTVDATGKTVRTSDDGGELNYQYDSWGNLVRVERNNVIIVDNVYDEYGQQHSLDDLAGGHVEYEYNAFDELVLETNALGQNTVLRYDNLGRLIEKDMPEGACSWVYYYVDGKFNDNVIKASSPEATMGYGYDDFGNLTGMGLTTDVGYLGKTYYYDDFDRLLREECTDQPMQARVDYEYSGTGYVKNLCAGPETYYFQGLSMDGQGHYTEYKLADGNMAQVQYQQQYPYRKLTPEVQDLETKWDGTTGDLLMRWDHMKGFMETFNYDELDRLTIAKVEAVQPNGTPLGTVADIAYDYDGTLGSTWGDLVQRGDIGKFNFNTKHAPRRAMGPDFPNTPNDYPIPINPNGQIIEYTSFHQPKLIKEVVDGVTYTLEFGYNAAGQRAYSRLTGPYGLVKTRLYMGNLERQTYEDGIAQMIWYVQGGDGLCAMIVANNDDGNSQNTYATYTDHLGSIVAVTEKVGNGFQLVAEQQFDPWGRKRVPQDWTYEHVPQVPDWLYRGYTGQESIEPFALINMNGRMYDPLNGRMLSVDNFIHGGTQGFNRYSYALNNPLKYSDPSGEFLWIPFVAGVVVGGVSGYLRGKAMNSSGMDMTASIIGGMIMGAQAFGAGSIVSGGVGAAVTLPYGGLIGMTAGGAVGGAVHGFSQHALSGSEPLKGAWQGALSGLAGAAVGGYISGSLGAFASGATAGALSSALRGNDGGEILLNSAEGGASALLLYQAQMWGAYTDYKNNDGEFTRQQFFAMSRAAQWSFAHGKERGGWFMGNKILLDPTHGSSASNEVGPRPPGSVARFHTHPNIGTTKYGTWTESHSPGDLRNAVGGHYISYVIGRQNSYEYSIIRTRPVFMQNSFLRYPYYGY